MFKHETNWLTSAFYRYSTDRYQSCLQKVVVLYGVSNIDAFIADLIAYLSERLVWEEGSHREDKEASG